MADILDHPIAYGRTAEIYSWYDKQVLKLFNDGYDLEEAQYELAISRAVQTSGLPIPQVGEIVQAKGRNGLTFQRVDGITMAHILLRKPWTGFHHARRMADLHARMHAITLQADIPRLHQRLANKINRGDALSRELKSKVLGILGIMPVGDRLCHGDFHPENILVTRQGEAIIDWIDATLGNPLADVARTTIIVLGAIEAEQTNRPFTKIFIRFTHNLYIRRYFSRYPGGESEYYRWLPIVAAARISENIPEIEK
jgi:Ser/Thr protein kinase RdoA (MazF antagonist)